MKPASIKKFDWLYVASVLVGLSGLAVGWDTINAATNAELSAAGAGEMGEDFAMGALLFGALLTVAISAAIWFLISVLRIEIVKWLLVAMVAWTVVSLPGGVELAGGFGILHVPSVLSTILSIAAIWFLFQPDAKAWFAEKRGGKRED